MANKTIQQLTPLTTADASDLLALYDVSGNGTKSITAANLLNTTITGLETTAKTIPAAINELNNNLNLYNIYIAKEITLTTQTIAGQNAGTWDYDISSQIPNGYNKIFSMYCSAGSYQCFCYTCYPYSNTFIRVQIKNTTNTEVTITPRIWCIFSKY